MYADDTTLYASDYSIGSIQTKLQSDVENVNKWCRLNNMALNPTKSNCMLIGSPYYTKHNNNLIINIDNSRIDCVEQQKILGVYFDRNLTWNIQVDKVYNKLNSKLGLLRRIKPYLNQK